MYNEAIKYLIKKYPKNTHTRWSELFTKNWRNRTKKEQNELEANMTDRDTITSISSNDGFTHDDNHIYLLLGQYYYGIEPKKELANLLITLGVVNLELSK